MVAALCAASPASAVTASVSGSTLTVTGDADADDIRIKLPGGDGITPDPDNPALLDPPNTATPYYVEVPVADAATLMPGTGCTIDPMATNRLECNRGGAAFGTLTVRVNAGAGNDYVRAERPNQAVFDLVYLSGQDGDDALFGSQTGDYLTGDAGNDLLDGGAGADFMSGGSLNALLPNPEGAVAQPASYGGAGAGQDRVYGGNFDDQITDGDNDASAPQPGVVTAQLNDDIIDGGVCAAPGGPGEAMPAGRPATAPATCPPLTNNVDGPEDHDAYMLGHRTRPLTIDITIPGPSQGAAGENEQIRRIEAVWAGSGDDRLYGRDGDLGDESLRGNGGNDHLEARGGDDELLGGDGQDTLLGGPGADIMWPGGRIISAPGAPTEMVSDGPDYVDGSTNSTIVGGHSMSDLVSYDLRTDNLRLDMTQPTTLGAPGENDTIVGVEDVMGGHRDDVIIGDAGVNLISGDPLPPVFNVPPDPPAYPFAPGGHAGNDHITTRDAVSDTVDCTEGTADVHIADGIDATINCETVDRAGGTPPPPPPAERGKVRIAGSTSAGSVTVGKTGVFTLKKSVITCPAATPSSATSCKYTGTVAAGKTKLGSRTFTVKAGSKRAASAKLTKKRLSTLKRRRSMRSVVTIKVVLDGKTTTKKVKVTLKPPKRTRR